MMYTLKLDYHLPGEQRRVCIRTFQTREAHRLNDLGYGVFTTPNEFVGSPKIHNLLKIRYAFFEIDDVPKEVQRARLSSAKEAKNIYPAKIIESKNSLHVYYKFKKGCECSLEDFTLIQLGLIKYFKADPKIKNVNRIMRAPGFKHMKDPMSPFDVKQVYTMSKAYHPEELKEAFPYTPPEKKAHSYVKEESSDLRDFISKSNNLDNLKKLSGTQFVKFETYIFKPSANGTVSIFVNGKSTSCFIDQQGLIGATHGPTIWQWLRYFGHSDGAIRRIIKDVFDV